MVKYLHEFEYVYCILEKKGNFISKIRRSKLQTTHVSNKIVIFKGTNTFVAYIQNT